MAFSPREYRFVLGVPNFANYESSASLLAVPRAGGEMRYVCIGEDRLSREKLSYQFPLRGIEYCLNAFGLENLRQVDLIVTDYARIRRWHNSGPAYRKLEHDYLKLKLDFPLERIAIIDHHDAHAASCFHPSGYDDAAILIVDGMGSELETQSLYRGRNGRIELIERGYDWGIGKLYSLVTGNLLPYGPEKGFGKVMGLAPYGEAAPGPVLQFRSSDRGMRTDYSAFFTRQPTSRLIAQGLRRCEDRTEVMQPHFARMAYDVQKECERQLVRMAEYAFERTGCRRLCLAGGVILNGRANHLILEQTPIETIWMPPAVSDTGLSFGLAVWGAMNRLGQGPELSVSMPHAYAGRDYGDEEIIAALDSFKVGWTGTDPTAVGKMVAAGEIVAWFEGASEFGPRALGHRSIVADPRSQEMKDRLNSGVKLREGYRPYAPSVLAEHARDWFDLRDESPFMLQVCTVRPDRRAQVPAITHVDGTARIQEVSREHSPRYWELIESFRIATGVPMVLNTSFNINREPIVETVLDALVCALGTGIDKLVLNGKYLVDCAQHRSPALVREVEARRKADEEARHRRIRKSLLTGYEPEEMRQFLQAENVRAQSYLEAARHELDRFLQRAVSRGLRVLLVGTRGHTAVLHDYVTEFVELHATGFVDVGGPGEPGALPAAYRELGIADVVWEEIDAVLVSTHEYQRDALAIVGNRGVEVVTLYDTAMDSLYYLLPERVPRVRGGAPRAVASTASVGAIDDVSSFAQAQALPTSRYGVIVTYHSVRPAGGTGFRGVNHITPDIFRAHLRQLIDNFEFVTPSELVDSGRRLGEALAIVTFDDGLRDVADYAAPVLAEFGIRATVFVPSAAYVENDPLLTHKRQLVAGLVGFDGLRRALKEFLDADNIELDLDAAVPPDVYRHDSEPVRRLKYTLCYRLAPDTVERFIGALFERHFDRAAVVEQLYLSCEQLLRLQDVGWELGGHSHRHLPLSGLSSRAVAEDIATNYQFIKTRLEREPRSFAYPFGTASSYNEASALAVKAAGFRLACVADPRIVKPVDIARSWWLPRFDALDLFDPSGNLYAEKLASLSTAD